MRIVYKYPICSLTVNPPPLIMELAVPNESMFMTAGVEGDTLVAWMLVETEVPATMNKHYLVMPTGVGLPPEYKFAEYNATVATHHAGVWHLFDATACYQKKSTE